MTGAFVSPQFALLGPIVLAVVGGCAGLLSDAFGRGRLAVSVNAVGLGFGAVAAMTALVAGLRVGEPLAFAYESFVVGGGFSAMHGIVCLLGAVVLWFGLDSLLQSSRGPAQASLVSFTAAACMALISTVDLLTALLALECIALAGYAFVAAGGGGASNEAAMKYLVQGSLAAGFLVMGVGIMFGLYGGSTDVRVLAEFVGVESTVPALAGMVLLFAAFMFKLGLVPFHSWAPDAYESVRPEIGAFYATAPKIAATSAFFMLFFRVFYRATTVGSPLHGLFSGTGLDERAAWLVASVAAASIVYGNLGGLRQRSYTRMLAYSGIAQAGYVMAAAVLLGPAMFHAVLMVVAYSIAAGGAFLVAAAVRSVRADWDGSIEGLAGVGRDHPLLGVSMVVLMMSLTGVPLTAGFVGKYLVFGVIAINGWTWLAIVGALGSVVSFGYYGAVLRSAFFEPGKNGESVRMPRRLSAGVGLFAIATMWLGIAPLLRGFEFIQRLFDLGFGG